MVVTQNQSIDQTSSTTSQLSSTDWNKVEISFKRKDFQVMSRIRYTKNSYFIIKFSRLLHKPNTCIWFQHSYVMPSTNTSQTNVSATSLNVSINNSSSQTTKPKKKQWRTLKQILAAEQVLPWPSVDDTGTKVFAFIELRIPAWKIFLFFILTNCIFHFWYRRLLRTQR